MAPRRRGGRGGGQTQRALTSFLAAAPRAPAPGTGAAAAEESSGGPSELSGLETSGSDSEGGAAEGLGGGRPAGGTASGAPGVAGNSDDDLDLDAFLNPFSSKGARQPAARKRSGGGSGGSSELEKILAAKRARASNQSDLAERQKSLHFKMEQIREQRAQLDAADDDDGGLGQMQAMERRGRADIGEVVAVEEEPSRFSDRFVRPLAARTAERALDHPAVAQSVARLPSQLQTSSRMRALVRQEILAGGWATARLGDEAGGAWSRPGLGEWAFKCAAYVKDDRAAFGALKTFAHLCQAGSDENRPLAHLGLPMQTAPVRSPAQARPGGGAWAPSTKDVDDVLQSLGYKPPSAGRAKVRKQRGAEHVNTANVFKLLGALPSPFFQSPVESAGGREDWGLDLLVALVRVSVSKRVGGRKSCLPDIIREIMGQIPPEVWDCYVDEAAASIGSGLESTSCAFYVFSMIPADSVRGRALRLKVACVVMHGITKAAPKGSSKDSAHCLIESGEDGVNIPSEVVSSLLESFGDPKELVSKAWKRKGLSFWDIYNLLRLFDAVVWQWQASESRAGNQPSPGGDGMRSVLKGCTDFVRKIGYGIGTSSERSSAEVVRTLSTEMESTFNHLLSKHSTLDCRA